MQKNDYINIKIKERKKIKKIWLVAMVLGLITAIEFLFSLIIPRGYLLTILFIVLTLIKAFYILAEFMHLRYEVKLLVWSIVLPLFSLGWLLLVLISEIK